jgi:hypothetical protein
MAIQYCSLHKQLFSQRYARWVTFSQETINEVRRHYELLRSTHVDASHLEVVEMSCDQCEAVLRQISQINAKEIRA